MITTKQIVLFATAVTVLGMISGCGQAPAPEKAEVIRPAKLIDVTLSSNVTLVI